VTICENFIIESGKTVKQNNGVLLMLLNVHIEESFQSLVSEQLLYIFKACTLHHIEAWTILVRLTLVIIDIL